MTRHPSSFNRRGRKRGRQPPAPETFVVETDLPDAVPIGANEIAAIERLLGAELDALLIGRSSATRVGGSNRK